MSDLGWEFHCRGWMARDEYPASYRGRIYFSEASGREPIPDPDHDPETVYPDPPPRVSIPPR